MSTPITNTVITIGRQFGSAGLAIGRQVAKDLGLKLYYKEIVDEIVTDDFSDAMKSDKKTESKSANSFLYSLVMDKPNTGAYVDMPVNHKRFISQIEAIKKIVDEGPCVLVGLCADYALADKDIVQTLIFDEIDAGISGRAADKVGIVLKNVAKTHQVICVTHLAQVAAYADNHLLISKNTENEKTFTSVKSLDKNGRINELARIMGGTMTDALKKSAEELLELSK